MREPSIGKGPGVASPGPFPFRPGAVQRFGKGRMNVTERMAVTGILRS